MHAIWEINLLRIEINPELVYPTVEIDESKIISSGNEINWMFGIIDHNTKEAKLWCVLSDKTKERLLPLIRKHVSNNYGLDVGRCISYYILLISYYFHFLF